MSLRKFKKVSGRGLSHLFHGLKGSAIFFMFAVAFFAFWKIFRMIASKDLLLSKYTIAWIAAGFIVFGFIYGLVAFSKKNHHYKLYTMTGKNFFINLALTLTFTLYFWYVLRNKVIPSNTIYLFFFVSFVLFYAFSALISNIHHHVSKKQHKKIKKSTIAFAVIFNPVFVLIYLWLFSMVVYNSVYVPCGVSVVGIDKNSYTGNTRNLGIGADERIVAIDDHTINSLQDARDYMNSLESTKEVVVETNKQTYLVETYQIDGRRYLGLLLEEKICPREY
ncbi:MAG TPA: hypothetical protein VEC16_02935 [Alphaproteobacteria bacterium]|nr:hypothetical protein [Alphaproteobacteria bacterium]